MSVVLAYCVRILSAPADICRLDDRIIQSAAASDKTPMLIRELAWTIVVASSVYGAVFGIWRSPEQALYSALKMPVLMFSVTIVSALVNSMLATVVAHQSVPGQTGPANTVLESKRISDEFL